MHLFFSNCVLQSSEGAYNLAFTKLHIRWGRIQDVLTMIPSFRVHVFPRIPARIGKAYYALATAHAALGTITEIAGLYVLQAAGTRVLPEKFRFIKYKLWMRTVLVLWSVVLLLGFGTYARWYRLSPWTEDQ